LGKLLRAEEVRGGMGGKLGWAGRYGIALRNFGNGELTDLGSERSFTKPV
jgi:hypothetical protein